MNKLKALKPVWQPNGWNTNTHTHTQRAFQSGPHRTHFIRHGRIVQLLQRRPLRPAHRQNVAIVVQSRQRLARHVPKAAPVARIELRLQQLLVVLVAGRRGGHRRRRAAVVVVVGQALELGLQILVLGRFVLVAEAALQRCQSARSVWRGICESN